MFEERPEEAHGPELKRKSKAILNTAPLGDQSAVGIIEMETTSKLLIGGLAVEAAVGTSLAVSQEINRHCGSAATFLEEGVSQLDCGRVIDDVVFDTH
jgi:hypothetical protein